MPPQLFRLGRFRRTASENEDEFDQYKVIIEEIKREHPSLPPSAVQQMAVEKFSMVKERRCSQNTPVNEMLAGLSNFRFGKDKRPSLKNETSNTNDTNEPEDRRRSLNPRTSVANIDTKCLSQRSLASELSEDSLEDSLQNIEASVTPPKRQGSRRGLRNSLKSASVKSASLTDVKEDEVLHASIQDTLAQSSHNSTKTGSSSVKRRSISDELPDEIKIALGEFDNIESPKLSNGKSENRRCGRAKERVKSSIASSFASVDSANFEGDFSAWGRKST